MSELSFMGKLIKAMAKAKLEHVGMELSYFDVVELLGELGSLKLYIDELESELDTSRQKLTDCDAKIADRDKALDDMVHELSRMEIDRDELEKTIEQLIEAGRALTSVAEWRYTILPELLAWDTLVDNIYKEREK